MHTYITGASGFVGSAITQELLAQGHRVSAQSRSPKKQKTHDNLSWVSSPKELNQPVDLLINLAGKPLMARWTKQAKQAFRDSRIGLTEALYRDFSERPEFAPGKVFNASAIGVYCGGQVAENESASLGSSFAASLCRDWEAAARRFEQLGSQVCCFRFGVVLDPEGGALKAMLPAFRFGLGGRLGSGKQCFSWVSRDDLVGALLWSIGQDNLPATINLTAPEPLSNANFTQKLAQHLHRPAIFPAPTFILQLLLGEGAKGFLLADLDVRPSYLQQSGYAFQHPDLDTFLQSRL